jgi:hypothetical protein
MDVGAGIVPFLLGKGIFKPPASCLRASAVHLRFAQLQGLGRHVVRLPDDFEITVATTCD